jgi:hypothetical protein
MTTALNALTAGAPLSPNWSTKTTQAIAEIKKMITFADAGADSGHISHSFKLRYWKLKRLTIKAFLYLDFWPRGHDCPGREFLLYHGPSNLSRGKSKKNKKTFFPKTLDKPLCLCYNTDTKSRR